MNNKRKKMGFFDTGPFLYTKDLIPKRGEVYLKKILKPDEKLIECFFKDWDWQRVILITTKRIFARLGSFKKKEYSISWDKISNINFSEKSGVLDVELTDGEKFSTFIGNYKQFNEFFGIIEKEWKQRGPKKAVKLFKEKIEKRKKLERERRLKDEKLKEEKKFKKEKIEKEKKEKDEFKKRQKEVKKLEKKELKEKREEEKEERHKKIREGLLFTVVRYFGGHNEYAVEDQERGDGGELELTDKEAIFNRKSMFKGKRFTLVMPYNKIELNGLRLAKVEVKKEEVGKAMYDIFWYGTTLGRGAKNKILLTIAYTDDDGILQKPSFDIWTFGHGEKKKAFSLIYKKVKEHNKGKRKQVKEVQKEDPLQALKLRYAKGEISRKEFLKMKKDLE